MKLVLVGYMGSGKSTIGNLLANALNYSFDDLDQAISLNEGMSIPELFQSKGEIYFRKQESVVLFDLLNSKKNMVLATGGGTPCYGTIMSDMSSDPEVVTIYLKYGLETLTDRLFEERHDRPLIQHLDSKELLNDFIRKHLFERSYYYNQAKIIMDCENLTPRELVEQLVMKLI